MSALDVINLAVTLAVAGVAGFSGFQLGRSYERREVLRYFAIARNYLMSGVANLVYRRVEGEFTDETFRAALGREFERRKIEEKP
jgi:hypothetical protein